MQRQSTTCCAAFSLILIPIASLLIAVEPTSATSFKKEEITCPLCKEKFEAFVVTSTNSFGGSDADFLRLARGSQPIHFHAIGCPHCYYAGYFDDFNENVKFSRKLANDLRVKLKPRIAIKKGTASNAIPSWVRYELIIQRHALTAGHDLSKLNHAKIANWYLHVAWCLRLTSEPLKTIPVKLAKAATKRIEAETAKAGPHDNAAQAEVELGIKLAQQLKSAKGNDATELGLAALYLLRMHGEHDRALAVLEDLEPHLSPNRFNTLDMHIHATIKNEKKYQLKAVEEFKDALDLFNKKNKLSVTYLIGEIHRRLGETKAATFFFEQVLADKDSPEWLVELTKQQKKRNSLQ